MGKPQQGARSQTTGCEDKTVVQLYRTLATPPCAMSARGVGRPAVSPRESIFNALAILILRARLAPGAGCRVALERILRRHV
jgi:hypothetical protein